MSLYDRLGGIFAISVIIDKFSDEIVTNDILGRNSQNLYLRRWHREKLHRLPGLKFMRTQWLAAASGGPFKFVPSEKCPFKGDALNVNHSSLKISETEFDEASRLLGRVLGEMGVKSAEKEEVRILFVKYRAGVVSY